MLSEYKLFIIGLSSQVINLPCDRVFMKLTHVAYLASFVILLLDLVIFLLELRESQYF